MEIPSSIKGKAENMFIPEKIKEIEPFKNKVWLTSPTIHGPDRPI